MQTYRSIADAYTITKYTGDNAREIALATGRDVTLVAVRPGEPMTAVKVAGEFVRPGDSVVSAVEGDHVEVYRDDALLARKYVAIPVTDAPLPSFDLALRRLLREYGKDTEFDMPDACLATYLLNSMNNLGGAIAGVDIKE